MCAWKCDNPLCPGKFLNIMLIDNYLKDFNFNFFNNNFILKIKKSLKLF